MQALPGIAEAAAVAYPDPRLGERTCAVVALVPGATLTLEALNRHLVDAGVATFMLPERLELVEALPRNTNGKVLKRACVEALLARSSRHATG